jgi:hypothetical protein
VISFPRSARPSFSRGDERHVCWNDVGVAITRRSVALAISSQMRKSRGTIRIGTLARAPIHISYQRATMPRPLEGDGVAQACGLQAFGRSPRIRVGDMLASCRGL